MSKNSLEEMAAHYNNSSRRPTTNPTQNSQYSQHDIDKLQNLKSYNLKQIQYLFPPGKNQLATDRSRSSILDDESQSLHSATDSRFSSNQTPSHQQPNSHQSISTNKYWTPSLGPILSRNPIDEEPSGKRFGNGQMSFRGAEPTSNSTLRTLSKTVGVEKYPHETYFEYNDFDVYVDAMSKRVCEADIKSKFNELKHSTNLLKMIAEAGPEEDIDQIFNKHMTPDLASVFDSSKPLYKMIADAGSDYSALRNIREEQILPSKRHSIQESSRANTQRGDPSSLVLGSAQRKLGSNYNQGVDSQNKLSEKHESFEAFLQAQGVSAPIYSHIAKSNGNAREIGNSKATAHQDAQSVGTNGNNQQDNNSFSFIKQIDENASMMHNSQAGVSTELHVFLMQNLREIMEVKEILKHGLTPGTMESRENLKTSREEKRDNDPSTIFVPNVEEDQLEQKLQEGQMERLVNKVQALNEKLKKYELESLETKRMSHALKKCFRIGKVKISDLIGIDVDIASLTLDHLTKDYTLQARFLYVYTTHMSLHNDAAVPAEQEQRLHFSEIEQIYYLEKPGSTYFMIKLLEKDTDKNWPQDSLRVNTQTKSKAIESLSHFYFLEIEDPVEMPAWELAFFVVNFKILAGNLSFSINKGDFLQVVKGFIQKYLLMSGETSRALVDPMIKPSIQLNGSPQLSRMGTSSSEQVSVSEKLGIIDVWNRKKNGNTGLQLPAFVKKRSEESDFGEIKEEAGAGGAGLNQKKVYQKQKSLPTRGMSVDEDLSSVEEGDSVGEGNLENSPDAREEKNKAHFIKTLSKVNTLELDDEVFAKSLSILLDGVVLSKYGKWGKSHDRHVKLSNDLTTLQWMHPLKNNKKRTGIDIMTVYSVSSGKKSMYFAKKKIAPTELELCFSIVAKARSLHLQAPNWQTRDYFVEALEYVLKEKNKLKRMADSMEIKARK